MPSELVGVYYSCGCHSPLGIDTVDFRCPCCRSFSSTFTGSLDLPSTRPGEKVLLWCEACWMGFEVSEAAPDATPARPEVADPAPFTYLFEWEAAERDAGPEPAPPR